MQTCNHMWQSHAPVLGSSCFDGRSLVRVRDEEAASPWTCEMGWQLAPRPSSPFLPRSLSSPHYLLHLLGEQLVTAWLESSLQAGSTRLHLWNHFLEDSFIFFGKHAQSSSQRWGRWWGDKVFWAVEFLYVLHCDAESFQHHGPA